MLRVLIVFVKIHGPIGIINLHKSLVYLVWISATKRLTDLVLTDKLYESPEDEITQIRSSIFHFVASKSCANVQFHVTSYWQRRWSLMFRKRFDRSVRSWKGKILGWWQSGLIFAVALERIASNRTTYPVQLRMITRRGRKCARGTTCACVINATNVPICIYC